MVAMVLVAQLCRRIVHLSPNLLHCVEAGIQVAHGKHPGRHGGVAEPRILLSNRVGRGVLTDKLATGSPVRLVHDRLIRGR